MTTKKSEVRVTLSCKAIQTIKRFLYFAPAALFEEDPAWKEIERAFRNTQPRPEPTDEEKQAMISQ